MNNFRRYSLLLIGVLLAAYLGSVQAVEFNRVQANKSTLTFGFKQMGVPMDGKFRQFAASISFDPARLDAAHAQLDINLASIDTGNQESDVEVMGKQWFNAGAFPAAQFVSTGVKALGGNRYEVRGKLTLKGRAQDVAAPFTFRQDGASGIFDGTFMLKRLDYAIGEGAWADVSAVANEVQIKFHVVADAVIKK